jgi:hypothetical protein
VSRFTSVIAGSGDQRDLSLDALCQGLTIDELLAECQALERFRRGSDNLYERVRALFFLYAIHRFHIPVLPATAAPALIPFAGFEDLLERRFEEAIEVFLAAQAEQGASAAISSALAASYRALGFQTLADQVRRSVRSVRGNQWMFRAGHTDDYPLRLRPELLRAILFSLSCARLRPSAWTSRTADGAIFSSSAWISPRARASSTYPSISRFAERVGPLRSPGRRSRPGSGSLTSRSSA